MMSPRIGEVVCNSYPDKDVIALGYTCIYSLYSRHGRCVYVGQSKSLESRLRMHKSTNKSFEHFEYFLCCDSDANTEETRAIVAKAPTKNATLPKNTVFISKVEAKKLLIEKTFSNIFSDCKVYQGNGRNKLEYIKKEDVENIAEEFWTLIQENLNYRKG